MASPSPVAAAPPRPAAVAAAAADPVVVGAVTYPSPSASAAKAAAVQATATTTTATTAITDTTDTIATTDATTDATDATAATDAPTAMAADRGPLPPNVHVHPPTAQMRALMTIIRSAATSRADWVFSADRVIRLVVEFALNFLPVSPVTVTTPVDGAVHEGVAFSGKILGVSVVRAGEAMEPALRSCCRAARIGKILIQRDEETAAPSLFFAKLPDDVASRHVLLLDPMLATGGSARLATAALVEAGVAEDKIIFVSVLASRGGLRAYCSAYPRVSVVTAAVDAALNAKKFIVPGVGDFGDRYFGTD